MALFWCRCAVDRADASWCVDEIVRDAYRLIAPKKLAALLD